jgi:hypothetical protein
MTALYAMTDYYRRTCNSWFSGSLQIFEREIVESFICEIQLSLRVYLPSSLIPTAHCNYFNYNGYIFLFEKSVIRVASVDMRRMCW